MKFEVDVLGSPPPPHPPNGPNGLCERKASTLCFTSTEASLLIRDGDKGGKGRESDRLDRGYRPKKTGETVDRRQINGSVPSPLRSG